MLVGIYSFTDAEKSQRFDDLCRLPNVHRFDARPPSEIPEWLCGLDVGLACYDTHTWAAFGQPIKIYEYLASGLPVVATNIEAVCELGDVVTSCPRGGDWIAAVEEALMRNDQGDVASRLAFARSNSWAARLEQINTELARI